VVVVPDVLGTCVNVLKRNKNGHKNLRTRTSTYICLHLSCKYFWGKNTS
jgi:hypothetical protein